MSFWKPTDVAMLRELAAYHFKLSANRKKERLYREECNLGPPLTTELERKHKKWGQELIKAIRIVEKNQKHSIGV